MRAGVQLSRAWEHRQHTCANTLAVTPAELRGESSGIANRQQVDSSERFLEAGSGIEPPTYGLRDRTTPTSSNLTQQETTNQPGTEGAVDVAELSCSGSSVVADEPKADGQRT